MSILTEEEIDALLKPYQYASGTIDMDGDDIEDQRKMLRSVESAVLAKLAGMELPKPVVIDRHIPTNVVIRGFTATQLHQAFAQGAASQLSAEPAAWKWRSNKFHDRLEFYFPPDDAYDEGTLKPLYTLKEPK